MLAYSDYQLNRFFNTMMIMCISRSCWYWHYSSVDQLLFVSGIFILLEAAVEDVGAVLIAVYHNASIMFLLLFVPLSPTPHFVFDFVTFLIVFFSHHHIVTLFPFWQFQIFIHLSIEYIFHSFHFNALIQHGLYISCLKSCVYQSKHFQLSMPWLIHFLSIFS